MALNRPPPLFFYPLQLLHFRFYEETDPLKEYDL